MSQDYNAFMQVFIDAWCNKDLETLMDCFTPSITTCQCRR